MPAFFARITNAGYAQYPDLMLVVPLEGFLPGTPPPRPHPQPPLEIWGPSDPRPTNPIAGIPGLPGYEPPPLDPNAPRPSHPIAQPGDPWWGQDLKPTHPIVLPPGTAIPPGYPLPPPGQPGSPSNPIPPGEVPPHAAQGIQKFYLVLQNVGVVGPYYMGPGGIYPPAPAAPPTAPAPGA